ncbi:MAG: helix-turn-helix domain-containing protein [Prevotella sp.]|nr:helix-turn-helix domain-containing protein [Prevotella sp.]
MAKIIDTADLSQALTHEGQQKKGVYIRGPFQLAMNSNVIAINEWLKGDVPYRSSDYQLNMVLSGSWCFSYNLQRMVLKEGDVVIMKPGTLVSHYWATSEINTRTVSIAGHLISERFPSFGIDRDFIVFRPDDKVWQKMITFTLLIQSLADEEELVVLAAAYSLLRYAILEGASAMQLQAQRTKSHPHVTTFKSFLALLNRYGIEEHKIAFYADRLALSPNYLNAIIKEVSGQTMMEWINSYLIDEARAALTQSRMTIEQVSASLHFPNSAFFCKFFKRHTGMRPSEYRKH